jgi:hypothetical protein
MPFGSDHVSIPDAWSTAETSETAQTDILAVIDAPVDAGRFDDLGRAACRRR